MVRLLTFTFLALAELGLRLSDLPRFLLEAEWRESLLMKVRHSEIASYFRFEFPTTGGATHQWITPVLNKVGALLFDPDLRLMFSSRATINFRQILERRMILLVNLSKGQLGEENSALLGAFLVAQLQKAALARTNGSKHDPFFLYLDEFQNYTTDNIKDILSESRKYDLSLILAHQYLSQLPSDLLGAVLNTTGTIACFRVGYQDASLLSREIFPPGSLERSWREIHFLRFGKYPIPVPHTQRDPLTHEELTTVLTQLNLRQFVAKQRGPFPPHILHTFEMPEPPMSEGLCRAREQLVRRSGQRYGRLKCEVREELSHEQTIGNSDSTTYYEAVSAPALPAGE